MVMSSVMQKSSLPQRQWLLGSNLASSLGWYSMLKSHSLQARATADPVGLTTELVSRCSTWQRLRTMLVVNSATDSTIVIGSSYHSTIGGEAIGGEGGPGVSL